MFLTSPIILCSFAAVSALSLQDAPASLNVSDHCDPDRYCWIDDWNNGPAGSWTWLKGEGNNANFDPPVTLTITVVTIVNTILDTTSTLTEFPPEYSYPPTNALGTHVETISFFQSGQSHTTVLTYPSEFIAWPEHYVWTGTLSSGGRCTTNLKGVTVPIMSNPQPTAGSCYDTRFISCIQTAEDPKGLFHHLAFDPDQGYWQLKAYAALMADQPALSSCDNLDIGPNWGAFTQTNWYTVHRVVTMGEDQLYPTSTTDVSSRKSDSTPVATGTGR
ncbi:hypothetical protein F4801DRAFT_535294 [Xylaria longipes]|nr:hypothetical protein F4801DRAFT_535294 [Xylaria longipes]